MIRSLIALGLLGCASAFAAPADDVRALLDRGAFPEAYQLARSQPASFGDPEFDFNLGIAALEAGVPGEAVLALERYVAVYPANRNARFNLARAYFALGEDQHARDEFSSLRAEAKPEDLETIIRFLDVIRARESRYRPTAGLWLDLGLGHDSNVNSGVQADRLVDIPGLLPSTPSPQSLTVGRADWFKSLSAGVQGNLPVAPGVSLYGMAALDARSYFKTDLDQFNQVNLSGNGGVTFLNERNVYRVGGEVLQQWIYEQDYLFRYGLNAEWLHQLGGQDRLMLGVSGGKMKYSDTLSYSMADKSDTPANSASSQRSGNYWGGSLGWSHMFGVLWQPVLNVSFGATREENTQDRPDFSRDVLNARTQIALTPASGWSLSMGATYMQAQHKGSFGQFSTVDRRDHYRAADAQVAYRINRQWSVMAEASASKQDSNIGLYDFSRNLVATKLRYELN